MVLEAYDKLLFLVLEPASAQGEHGWIDTTWHIQRGAQSETSACTQGEYG